MDELGPGSAGADPFRPAERSENEAIEDAGDGSWSRRAERLQRLWYLAGRAATALLLIASGAFTARFLTAPRIPADEPSSVATEARPYIDPSERDYPDLENLLAAGHPNQVNERRSGNEWVRPRVVRSRGIGTPKESLLQGTTTAASSGGRAAGRSTGGPTSASDRGGGPTKSTSDPKHAPGTKGSSEDKEPRPKPEPAPEPDRNLFHVWKQGTSDHIYYWEEWKTVDYFAPQEYYLYRDGNGSEGSFFSEQVEGTIPLRTDDGQLGYVYSQGGDGRMPLYYLRGPTQKRRRDLFTSSSSTKETFIANGWADYGVVGYVSAPFEE